VKLLAISDLHVRHKANREAVEAMAARPDDWLLLVGDLGDNEKDLRFVFETLGPRFKQLVWVPGNHELWTKVGSELRGVAHYEHLVTVCREYGVLNPEDPYPLWEGEGGPCYIAPLFLLYDYSFCPDGMDKKEALAWAAEHRVVCTDEFYLSPSPHPTREDWCHDRLRITEERLKQLPADVPTVLVNHFQLRLDLVRLPRVPRFCLWCGTRATEDWHIKWHAKAVVSGHLHMRSTDWRDGVRFEEVALGYPRDWKQRKGIDYYVREVLPGSPEPRKWSRQTVWHR